MNSDILHVSHKLTLLSLLSTVDNLITASAQDSTPYFIGIIATILIVFVFIAFKIMSMCWASHDTSKRTQIAVQQQQQQQQMPNQQQNDQNGATKLTNHSNNLLIISTYNGSLSKVIPIAAITVR
jgi:uncharacterized membrane protein YhiD involved in acid resistance